VEWSDEGIVLAARRHGEGSAIVSLLTLAHGRHLGLVRGGAGRRARGIYQPGNQVSAHWRARLSDHLGTFTCELTEAHAATLMEDALALAGLSAACALAEAALPEREPHAVLYEGTLELLASMRRADRLVSYVHWELGLLAELGYGLDLTTCAATGRGDDLAYVSPRTGRAVSRQAGAGWHDKLLALPGFLTGVGEAGADDVLGGLALTGFFLERFVFAAQNRRLPPARIRLIDQIRRTATISGVTSR
jgi:DNA repair protein RecO (recombination protein O)